MLVFILCGFVFYSFLGYLSVVIRYDDEIKLFGFWIFLIENSWFLNIVYLFIEILDLERILEFI